VGIVITCLLILPFYQRDISPREVEIRAKEMGMIYPDEVKALPNNEGGGKEK